MSRAPKIDAEEWQSLLVMTFNGSFDTHIKSGDDYDTLSLGQIFAAGPANRPKPRAPAIIPSSYNGFDGRNHEAQRTKGRFQALCGDVDKGNHDLESIERQVVSLVGEDVARLIYSTASSTEEDKRWRIVVPLAQPLDFKGWNEAQEAFFDYMEAHGVLMDRSLARAAQPVYLPNVPPERRGEDGEPLFFQTRASDGVGARLDHPPIATAIGELRARREVDTRAKGAARQAVVARAPTGDRAGGRPIETFNLSHRVEDLLPQYGYEEAPNGEDWRSPLQQSESFATRVFTDEEGHERWVSLSGSDAEAGLGVETANGHRRGDAFDLFVHYEHGGDRAASLAAWKKAQAKAEALRRKEQRETSRQIGAGSDTVPKTEIYTVDGTLKRFVLVTDGSQVADLLCPQAVLSLQDFRNATAGSKYTIPNGGGGTKTLPVSKVWLEHPDRLEVDVLTFHPGAPLMTVSPEGRPALNLWRPRLPSAVPENWEYLVAFFVAQIRWLWGEHADAFLDWLAHIHQWPGELPHYGWIHISRIHGKGRNWIAAVLARLWAGYVAASLDLIGVLESGFNNRLSRCMLAIVDEINEGGNQSYRHAQTLRQYVTAEVREINPKFGRRRVEYNTTRWLFFSNHTGAIPLDEDDRRFWVVSHEGPARDEAYYTTLYGLLCNPHFIASVAEFLRTRDISGFNPGQRPPATEAKSDLIALTRSSEDDTLRELVSRWPVDIITALSRAVGF